MRIRIGFISVAPLIRPGMLNLPPQLKLQEEEEEEYGGGDDECDSPQDRIPTCKLQKLPNGCTLMQLKTCLLSDEVITIIGG